MSEPAKDNTEGKDRPEGDSAPKPKAKPKPRKLIQPQRPMKRMLSALAPVAVSAVYFFGWRVLAVLGASLLAGAVTEYIMTSRRGKPVSMACFVTGTLYGLSLPVTTPIWVAVVGAVVAVLFGKEVFGGFGKNFANPAIVGRAFVYICFPVDLTSRFVPAFSGFPGGFARWSFAALDELPASLAARLEGTGRTVADAVTMASPMWVSGQYGFDAVRNAGNGANLWDMFLGTIGGTFQAAGETGQRILAAGSMGEGCAALILLAGVYLLWTKTANWRLMLAGAVGLVFANLLFRNLAGFDGVGEVPPVAWQLLSGTTLYALVFMFTDPVSAPKKHPAQFAYAFLIGFLVVFLRWRGVFVAAASFSILLGNLTGPLMDVGAEQWAAWRKARAKAAAEASSPKPAAEAAGPEGGS